MPPSPLLRRLAAIGLGPGLALAAASGSAPAATITPSPSFSVGATVQNGCVVSGNIGQTSGLVFGAINFGSFSALNTGLKTSALGPSGGSQALLVCTAGTTAQLSIDAGLHAVGVQRRLANGSGAFVPYSISTTVGGNQPVLPGTQIGLALGTAAQALPLQGSLLLPGVGLPAGLYSDTVQVTLTW
ncbi:fimbrial major subunit CsuA/B family protein [Xylophilus rhododendri]|uniref:Fimbrial major subunit CsuA/B family protein n=1 Tax=Xylophilus rhododendri TaxID=2697032 RepID=A0A857J7C6_9BURK|nr:spore coat protein U domain-containing protein [Xylophilus rhododendri]QHI98979.1 fimbrial major subunit CsuA/B family protein [Xylophilus rhododendri]